MVPAALDIDLNAATLFTLQVTNAAKFQVKYFPTYKVRACLYQRWASRHEVSVERVVYAAAGCDEQCQRRDILFVPLRQQPSGSEWEAF